MEMSLREALENRRSIYTLSGETTLPDEALVALVGQTIRHIPSSFNSQSSRAALLLGESHKKLWEIVLEALRPQVPPDKFGPTQMKVAGFSAAYGTVLFFDDTAVTQDLARRFPLYQENFPVWAQQSCGMLQYALWCRLEEAGLGANLQHYNPLIDEPVRRAFSLPESWMLVAQMPFGTPTAKPGAKKFVPVEERLRVL